MKDYVVTLNGRNVSREIELPASTKMVRIGTTQKCDVRFREDVFFSPFEIELAKGRDDQWSASCSEEIFFSSDGVKKLAYRKLEHGESVEIRYAETGAMLMCLDFAIDFERLAGRYDRHINLEGIDSLTIGGLADCNIRTIGDYTSGDRFRMQRTDGGFVLTELHSLYGAYLNGARVDGEAFVADCSFLSIAEFFFYLKDDVLYCSKDARLEFSGVAFEDEDALCNSSPYPRFNRSTRVQVGMDTEKIPILDPPQKPEKPRSNIVVQLLPAVAMLAITAIMRPMFMSSGSSGYIYISIAMLSIGVVTSVVSIVSERLGYRKSVKERLQKYNDYISKKKKEIEGLRTRELDALNRSYPSTDSEIELVKRFSSDLFDRRPGDDDFLDVRLGLGKRESLRQVDYKRAEKLETDELAELPGSIYEQYRYITNSPIVVKFASAGCIGVVGSPAGRDNVLKSMFIDICTRQYSDDVRLFFIVEEANEALVHWARNVPHVQNEMLVRRNIVCDEESKNQLFEFLFNLLTSRASEKDAGNLPHIVIFVLDECGLKNHPLSRFIDGADQLGVTFVFMAGRKDELPLGCSKIITLDDAGETASIVSSADGRTVTRYSYDLVKDADAHKVADMLAPVYCEEVSLESDLVKNISLFEMLDILSASDLNLNERWARSTVYRSMAAPLGVSKTGIVTLDLSDKADGPHGLVAGTTGSGKSEILQTYILCMASLFHPHEVGFLIIDFKGGGMVNQFRDLPHLIGAITNIDGREIERSLKSIRAELQKRQRCFAEADVNHINNYIKLRKSNPSLEPLPHLIIIVDEFAELKAEQPDFMKELISASRIGRSLGVHLILATQKPSGQVSEQIWSNSRFKLCLKVQSKEDSNEMIKSPLAAEIKEPGRAYLQVGNNEVFELFQSAYSGAPEHVDETNVREFKLYKVEKSGKRTQIFEKRKAKTESSSTTQLDAIVKHVNHHCMEAGIRKLPEICLPALEDAIGFPRDYRLEDALVPLGVYDDPDNQYQGRACFDVTGANTFVIGSSQTGKTNLLQLVVRALAHAYSPREAVLYIVDFSSMILKNFESLNHVGGVVLPSEDEKFKNLIKMLIEEIAHRKQRMLDVGVSSFAAYLEAGYSDFPRIVVMMDGFATFKELYAERFEDDFLVICREGVTYGISVIVTNPTTSGFGYKYLSNFSTKIAFSLNDSSEYGVVFDRCRIEPKPVVGRSLIEIDKNLYEMQAYLAFEGEKEIDRVGAMRSFIDETNARYEDMVARSIPSVPDDLSLAYIENNYPIAPNEIALALDYATVEPVRFNLDSQFVLSLVGGTPESQKSALEVLLADIREHYFERPVKVAIVDDLERSLRAYADAPYVTSYTSDFSEIDRVIDEFSLRAEARYDAVRGEGRNVLENESYMIAIINSEAAVEHLSGTKDVLSRYQFMSKQLSTMRVFFVFAGISNASVPFSAPALLKELKESKRALVFNNMADMKFFDISAAQARAFKAPLEKGQAFYFADEVTKVRLAALRTVDSGER